MTATANDPRDSLGLIGLTIDDKYVVESVVGEGGFGVVYRATHKLWQKPVAIKCFKTLMDAAPAMREQLLKDFIQEGALLSELSARTASIVQARDVGTLTTPNGAWVPYMVLEWLEGRTLEDWSEKHGMRPWPLELAMTLLEPIATALDVAHVRNIAHRDIKPANIFICGDVGAGEVPVWSEHTLVKLLDFGIAKVVQSAADQGMTKTQGQVTAFTPSYGAPEQFSRTHGATGPWTDVYALALILVELVTGKYALDGEDFIQLGMASADPSRRPTPRTLGVDPGDAVESVVAKALAIKPANRYQRAGQFWNELRVAIGAQPLRGTTAADLRVATGPASEVRYSSVPGSNVPGSTAQPMGTGDPPRSSREAFAATAVAGSGPMSGTLQPNTSNAAVAPKSKAPVIAIAALLGLGVIGGGVFFATRGGEKPKDDGKTSATTATPKASASESAAVAKPTCPTGMAAIDGGQFFMGTDDAKAEDDEKPAHNVTLSPFCIDLKEVTTADYKACSDGGKCKRAPTDVDWPDVTAAEKKIYGPTCNMNDPSGKAKHPINCVDWDMASIYCGAQDKRLPTEAEWEFAARGPDGRIYPWGDDPPDGRHLNACGKECLAWATKNKTELHAMYETDDGFPTTAPVGSFPMGASRYGLLDIVGNVWEWTSDWEARYGDKAQTDPKGPADGTERVVRGGAWTGADPSWVRPSQRYAFPPATRSFAVGFRCAKTLK
jgi:formylglycine-generating enzyme required for sulfatase activity/serine/threonine protein kinase